MTPRRTLSIGTVLMVLIAGSVVADPIPEGTTGHGQLEPTHVGEGRLGGIESVDEETRRKIDRHWIQLRAKTGRTIPPLPGGEAPTSDTTRRPTNPETVVGANSHAPEDFVLLRNSTPSSSAPAGFSSVVNEPSVVAHGDQVFFTGNWYAASSTDGGNTFSYVNPFTGPFPDPPSGSFCCDQATAYDPQTNSVVWLQQYFSDASTGVHRLSVDQGADGTYDCFYDISPQTLGFAANNWTDFPDLVISDNWVYHSGNVFSTTTAGFTGAYVARYDLGGMTSCGSVPFDTYADTAGFFSFKLSRGATTEMFFADHISTSSLRIWRWPDGSSAPTSFDRTVSAWSNSARTCPGPDGLDWCGFIDRRMAGAYVADGTVGFFWVPSQDGTFSMPYTRVAQFSEATLTLTGEPIVWSGSIAFVYPSVAVNSNGDIGGTIMAGGASLHVSCVAWLADDVNGDTLAPLNNEVARTGSSGPSINRSGDYNSSHRYYPNQKLFAGSCFTYQNSGAGEARYILFGREGSGDPSAIFTDGFESGNTTAWSLSVP